MFDKVWAKQLLERISHLGSFCDGVNRFFTYLECVEFNFESFDKPLFEKVVKAVLKLDLLRPICDVDFDFDFDTGEKYEINFYKCIGEKDYFFSVTLENGILYSETYCDTRKIGKACQSIDNKFSTLKFHLINGDTFIMPEWVNLD